jgi:hypothetical protein
VRPLPASRASSRSRFALKNAATSRQASGRRSRYRRIAACSGAAMLKVLNWCTLRSSRVSSGGATQ